MRRRTRIALWIVSAVVLVALVGGGLFYAMFAKFYPSAPEPNYPPALNLAQAQRQDFDYFRNYFDYNKAYSPQAREQAEKLLAQYQSQAGKLSSAAFDLAVARMVALADNGHSTIFMGPFSRHHNRLPCRFYKFADGFFVLRARPACADLLGAKVVAIDGHPVEHIVDGMFKYSGGPRNHYDQFKAVFFLESPELLHAAGFADASDRETLHVRLKGGTDGMRSSLRRSPTRMRRTFFRTAICRPRLSMAKTRTGSRCCQRMRSCRCSCATTPIRSRRPGGQTGRLFTSNSATMPMNPDIRLARLSIG